MTDLPDHKEESLEVISEQSKYLETEMHLEIHVDSGSEESAEFG